MKFYRLSILFITAIVATSVLASTSKAQALTWALKNINFTDGNATGTFDYDQTSNTYSNINIKIAYLYLGVSEPVTFTQADFNPAYSMADFSPAYSTASKLVIGSSTSTRENQLTLNFTSSLAGSSSLVTGAYYVLNRVNDDDISPKIKAGSSVSIVPFDIPGGGTIPAVGGLLALGLMRKARKSLASNTRISEPISEMVS
ncbi:hypothetical protein [Nostoc sp.]|uniref:hypothetical protein n=1 Tax=Nostoc sp. TaxID=1180 RepID=UPI002FF5F084